MIRLVLWKDALGHRVGGQQGASLEVPRPKQAWGHFQVRGGSDQ